MQAIYSLVEQMRTCDPILDMAVSQADLEAMYRNNPAQAMRDLPVPAVSALAKPILYTGMIHVKPRSKYGNIKVEHEGMKFDSKKELRCWQELKLRERAGEIWCLQRQVAFDLSVAGKKIGRFTADFVWYDAGGQIVADAKSPPTRKEVAYRLRKRIFEALYHPLVIREL